MATTESSSAVQYSRSAISSAYLLSRTKGMLCVVLPPSKLPIITITNNMGYLCYGVDVFSSDCTVNFFCSILSSCSTFRDLALYPELRQLAASSHS